MKKSLLAILGLSANLFLIGCADDQARQQIADTNQRLSQIQQNVGVLDNKVSNQKVLDLLNQINDLQRRYEVAWRECLGRALARYLWSTFICGTCIERPKPLCNPHQSAVPCL